jgi:hypothetical protein
MNNQLADKVAGGEGKFTVLRHQTAHAIVIQYGEKMKRS